MPTGVGLHGPTVRLAAFQLPSIRWDRAVRFGPAHHRVRLDTILSIDGDYPVLGGHLRIRLPGATLAFELRLRLITARF